MTATTANLRLLAGSREPVRLATTANIPRTKVRGQWHIVGLVEVDGVEPVQGDRILVKDSDDASWNGIWLASSGNWERAPDGRDGRTLNRGVLVPVQEGTANANTYWRSDTIEPEVGEDDIAFSLYLTASTAANVDIVAANIADINTAADNIANINITAGINAEITITAGIQGQIVTVAGIDGEVVTVAGLAPHIPTLAALDTEIAALGPNAAAIASIYANMTAVLNVEGNLTPIGVLAALDTEITALGAISAELAYLYSIRVELLDVQSIGAAVVAVALIESDVSTVAGVSAQVVALAAIETELLDVWTVRANIVTLAGLSTEITSLAGLATELAGLGARTVEIDALYAELASIAAKQNANDNLDALSGLTGAADRLPYFTGLAAMALATFTSFGRTLLALADYTALRAGLGLATSDSPQFTAINLGHASDTTLTRVSAGVVAIEGSNILKASDLGSTVQAYDADTLKGDVADQTITGGSRITSLDLGTISSGTVTPDPGDRPKQRYVNGGAHTLAPPTQYGFLELTIVNNASAGAITTSGFTKVVGSFTTTNTNKFKCYISADADGSLLSIQALQ